MEMKKQRELVRKTLEEKLGEKSAAKYENAIFEMSKRDSVPYAPLAYEKLGQLMVSSSETRKEILEDINNSVCRWDCRVYKKQKADYKRILDRSVLKPTAIKGVYFCKVKGCDSDEFYCWAEQRRGGDEGMTQLRACAVCGKRSKS